MAQARVLFADNDLDFLNTRREFLEQEGYAVITASSPIEVQKKLAQETLDLAIVDIRLINDDDEKDNSGLDLAKAIGRSVPVLVLTGYPSAEYARQALKIQPDGSPAVYDFVVKREGPEAMLTAVKNTLEIVTKRPVISTELETKVITPWENWSPGVALISLLAALGTGIVATALGDPKWLIGTVALAILAVFFIGLSTE